MDNDLGISSRWHLFNILFLPEVKETSWKGMQFQNFILLVFQNCENKLEKWYTKLVAGYIDGIGKSSNPMVQTHYTCYCTPISVWLMHELISNYVFLSTDSRVWICWFFWNFSLSFRRLMWGIWFGSSCHTVILLLWGGPKDLCSLKEFFLTCQIGVFYSPHVVCFQIFVWFVVSM